jgi:SsrA-binding protein
LKAENQAPTVANRRAKFLYFIEETLEAGVMLTGSEVKAIRAGRANLVGLHIGPYDNAGPYAHEARRERKLLLHRRELDRLGGKIREAGYTLIATKLYFNKDGRIKAEVALAKGKKAHDKRQTIREREGKKEVARAMKHYKR